MQKKVIELLFCFRRKTPLGGCPIKKEVFFKNINKKTIHIVEVNKIV